MSLANKTLFITGALRGIWSLRGMCSSEAPGLLIKLYLMPRFFHALKRPELELCRDAVRLRI